MKRTDTKLYRSIAEGYCNARKLYENHMEAISKRQDKLDKYAKAVSECRGLNPETVESVEEMFSDASSTLKLLISLNTGFMNDRKADVERYGRQLMDDYGVTDLDMFYLMAKKN